MAGPGFTCPLVCDLWLIWVQVALLVLSLSLKWEDNKSADLIEWLWWLNDLIYIKHIYIYILYSQRWRSSIQLAKAIPGADCSSDHELLIAKFRLKLKKRGKTTRPFRYDLNEILYNYTVEGTDRFKGLDLIECLKNCGRRFMTMHKRQRSKLSPRKRNAKGCLRRPYK